MKFFITFLFVIILLSCSNNTIEEIKEVKPNATEATSIDTLSEKSLAVQENPSTIEDFPKVWLRLDKVEDSYIINEYCEAETQQIHINKEGENWFIDVLYGQDGQQFKVIEFDAYEETRENFEIMYGSFVLENPDYPDMDLEMYDFMWNKDLMFCDFEGFFQDKTKMVSEENRDNYGTVKENCDYLNEYE